MKLFAGLKKIREYERLQLPFLKSVLDFDIVVEIGYAEERGHPVTLKQLFLLAIGSRSTIRRKLATLIEQGVIVRRRQSSDHRSSVLLVSSSTLKLLTKYGGTMGVVSASHFK
jgi:hypothetical protein